ANRHRGWRLPGSPLGCQKNCDALWAKRICTDAVDGVGGQDDEILLANSFDRRCNSGGSVLGILCVKRVCHVSHCARVGGVFGVGCGRSVRIAETNRFVCVRSCTVTTSCHPGSASSAAASSLACGCSSSMVKKPPGASHCSPWSAIASGILVPSAEPPYSAR